MTSFNPNRRTVLKASGVTIAALAGCLGDDGNGSDDDGGDDGSDGSDGGDSGEGPFEIEPDTEIMLRADSMTWYGKSPSDIEDVENPTLQLQEGETYTIGWDEGDGVGHNIALWDGDGSAIDSTSITDEEEPTDQTLEFEASSDLAEYVCEPHSSSGMSGDIEIQ